MPRPRKCRRVGRTPVHTFYKPQGVPLEDLIGVSLSVEGLEAIRLADADGRNHDQASEMMGVSRPTFSRILNEARQSVARALSNGWAIQIDGGNFQVVEPSMAADQTECNPGGGMRCAQKHRPGKTGGRHGRRDQNDDSNSP